MRLTIEMTLNANTAKRFKETAERLAGMDLGDDGLLAAAILMRIAANYERAREAAGADLGARLRKDRQDTAATTIPLEDLSDQSDE